MSDTFDHEADAWDSLVFHGGRDDNEPVYARGPRRIVCAFCGKKNLRWHSQQKQTLVNSDSSIHDCRAGGASPDAFDVFD